jgi:DeoR/GlpR family transcriptional regulator of sugar metabolism
MIHNAHQRIVVADCSKCGRIIFTSIAPLTVANTIIADSDIHHDMLKSLHDPGIEVLIVHVGG